jgi:hypothetical protein
MGSKWTACLTGNRERRLRQHQRLNAIGDEDDGEKAL